MIRILIESAILANNSKLLNTKYRFKQKVLYLHK